MNDTRSAVFVSYARRDDERFAKRVAEALRAESRAAWLDRDNMPSRGRTFRHEIREAIAQAERVVLIVGPASMKSAQVQAEWKQAVESCTPVIVVLRLGDESLIPAPLLGPHYVNALPPRTDEEVFAELKRIVGEPVRPLGRMQGVDALPEHFVAREDARMRLQALVLADLQGPEVQVSRRRATALWGMSGVGKSVLAAAFARSCAARRAFPDGIACIKFGPVPDVLACLRSAVRAFEDKNVYAAFPEAEQGLTRLLSRAERLLVLDDIWQVEHVEPFVNALGERARLVFTTRDAGLATALGAQECPLDVLGPADARALLDSWLVSDPGSRAGALLAECGYLPLAIALCGAMIRDGTALEHVLDALREADLGYLDGQLAGYPYPGVLRAMQVSLDMLGARHGAARERYLDLAAFLPGASVPEAAIFTLWRETGGLSHRYAAKTLAILERASLLRRSNGRVTLHDLQRAFLASGSELKALHRRLLRAYAEVCPEGWPTGPNDGYFFQNLPRHLEAVKDPGLRRLLTDARWMRAKLAATDVAAIEADCALVDNLGPLREALELSAHVLARDPSQLSSQLRGRLGHELIADLFVEEPAAREPRLRPLSASLAGVGQPLVRVLAGHSNVVLDVALSPDGTRLASGSMDHTAIVWDLKTGALLHRFENRGSIVTRVAWTPDGQFLVTAGGLARVWDGQSGQLCFELDQKYRSTGAIALSPEGKLAAGDDQGHVTLWNLSDGRQLWRARVHKDAVSALAFGRYILSGARDSTAAVLAVGDGSLLRTLGLLPFSPIFHELDDLGERVVRSKAGRGRVLYEGRKEAGVLPGHTREITAIVMCGERRAATGSYDGSVRIWDVESGEELSVLRHPDAVFDVALASADRLVTASDPAVRVWNAQTGELLRTMTGHTDFVTTVAVTSDGRTAVSGSSDFTVRTWDLQTGAETLVMGGHTGQVRSIALAAEGRMAFSGANDSTVRVWNLNPVRSAAATGHRARVNAVALFAEGRFAITGGGTQAFKVEPDPTVRLWDASDGRMLCTLGEHSDIVTRVAVAPDERRAVSGSDEGGLRLWDLETRAQLHVFSGHGGRVEDIQFSPDGTAVLSCGYDRVPRLWDLATGALRREFVGHDGGVNRVRFLGVGRQMVSSSSDGSVRLWDVESGHVVRIWRSHDKETYALAVTVDGSRVLSGGVAGAIECWSVEQSAPLTTFTGHTGPVTDLLISEDGSRLVSAAGFKDCSVRTWALDGKPIAVMREHTAYVVRVLELPGRKVVSASLDGTVRLLNMDSGEPLALFTADSAVYCCAVHRSGLIVAGEDTGRLHFLRVD
jgi:WD40 repeat protein